MHQRPGSSKLFRCKATSDCEKQRSRTRHTQDGPEADLVDIVDFRTRDCSHSRIRKCNVAPPWPKTRCVTITLPYLLNLSTRTSIETRNQPAYPTTKPVDGGGLEPVYYLVIVQRAKNKRGQSVSCSWLILRTTL